jgi:hypothetical protein
VLDVVGVGNRDVGEGDLRPVHGPLAVVRDVARVAVEWRVLVVHGDVLGVVVAVAVERRHSTHRGEVAPDVPGFEVAVPVVELVGGHATEGRQPAQAPAEGVGARQPVAAVVVHHAVAGVDHVAAGGVVARVPGAALDVAPLGEKLGFLLHLLHLPEGAVRVDEPRDGDALVVLVADHVLDAVQLLELLLHLLLALLTAHGNAERQHWEVPTGSLRVDRPRARVRAAVRHRLLVVARVVHRLPIKHLQRIKTMSTTTSCKPPHRLKFVQTTGKCTPIVRHCRVAPIQLSTPIMSNHSDKKN